jgi:hypothetical protein
MAQIKTGMQAMTRTNGGTGDQARAGVTIDELAARIDRLEVRTGISDA